MQKVTVLIISFIVSIGLVLATIGCSPASVEETASSDMAPEDENGARSGLEESTVDEDKEEEDKKTIAELTEDHTEMEGLFTFFQDPEDGRIQMLIREDQLDRDFIYFSMARNSTPRTGHRKGTYRSSYIFRIDRHFDRLDFKRINTHYVYDPESPLARSAQSNINTPVIGTAKIVAEDEEAGTILIEADDLFLSEAFALINFPRDPESKDKNPFKVGKLSKDKTRLAQIKAFPENIRLDVDYVYENPAPTNYGGAEVTDPRYLTISHTHHLLEAPENDYQMRRADPRMGYFLILRTDLTEVSYAPYKDVIRRWHLVKKNPRAALSDPVEPITFWIENTTPVEFRETVRDAVLAWNEAFESAGFTNAIAVNIQPDDAEWDAEDIRYNVLRWVSSPELSYGGYGPSFSDPRTGQMLGADIMLEFTGLRGHLLTQRMFVDTEEQGMDLIFPEDPYECSYSHYKVQDLMASKSILHASGADDQELTRLSHETLFSLIMHEVGHTLGMAHNFKASRLHSPEDLVDPGITRGVTVSTVMEYDPVNLAPLGRKHGDFSSTRPGPYDHWVIQYGYSEALDDPEAEEARLQAILNRSNEPGLDYANDADDMRWAGKGIDPEAMIFDMSTDPLRYAEDRMLLIENAMGELMEKMVVEGDSYNDLLTAFLTLTARFRWELDVVSKQIGGVYVDGSVAGQQDADLPLRPVPLKDQQHALALLSNYLFAPNAWVMGKETYPYLLEERRGWRHWEYTLDPKVHERVLSFQGRILDQILHPTMLKRMTNSSLYGNEYPIAIYLDDLTKVVFEADIQTEVNTFRQNLQLKYIDRLVTIFREATANPQATAAALYQLQRLADHIKSADDSVSLQTRAHRNLLLYTIDRALSVDN